VPAAGDARDGRVAVSEQEGTSSTLSPASGARDATVWRNECIEGTAPGYLRPLMKDGEGRLPVLVRGALLCLAQRAGDVPLGEGAP
jgi:hypothetical protein